MTSLISIGVPASTKPVTARGYHNSVADRLLFNKPGQRCKPCGREQHPWIARCWCPQGTKATSTVAFASGDHVYLALDHPWSIQHPETPKTLVLAFHSIQRVAVLERHKLGWLNGLPAVHVPGLCAPSLAFGMPVLGDELCMHGLSLDDHALCNQGHAGEWLRISVRGFASAAANHRVTESGNRGNAVSDRAVVSMDIDTQTGDCGSPIFAGRTLVGVVAGYSATFQRNFMWPAGLPPGQDILRGLPVLDELIDQAILFKKNGKRAPPPKARKTPAPAPKAAASAPARRPPRVGAGTSRRGARTDYMGAAETKVASQWDTAAYMRMLMDPHDPQTVCRYPDEVLVPTATSQLFTIKQFTALAENTTSQLDYSVFMSVKALQVAAVASPAVANIVETFPTGNTTFNTNTSDFGAAQAGMASNFTKDRTVAAGIRVSLTGLPTSNFMPRGRLYCLQLSFAEVIALQSLLSNVGLEEYLLQMVIARKGFCFPMKDLTQENASLVFLPDSPGNYLMSATNSCMGQTGYLTGGHVDESDSLVVDAPPFLAVLLIGTGASNSTLVGTALQIELALCVEGVPTVSAAGIVATKSQPPSAAARDSIAKVTQALTNGRAGARSIGEFAQGVKQAFSNPIVRGALGLGAKAIGFAVGGPGGAAAAGIGYGALTGSLGPALGTMGRMASSLPRLTNG